MIWDHSIRACTLIFFWILRIFLNTVFENAGEREIIWIEPMIPSQIHVNIKHLKHLNIYVLPLIVYSGLPDVLGQ